MYDVFDMQIRDYDSIIDRTGFDPDNLGKENADQHFAVLDEKQQIRARCSIWWRDTAAVHGEKTGAIGHYAATDERFGAVVLDHACRTLGRHRCKIALGPLDGNTWRRYRFVTERGTARPFFLEPDNPDQYPVHFERTGFKAFARYVSEINPSMATRQPELGSLRKKMDSLGVLIRPFNASDPIDDLDGIFEVVRDSFKKALLYTPLDRQNYRDMYMPLLKAVDPRLMLVAEQDGEIVGFVFAPPDVLQKSYQDNVDAIVIKTIAILPRKELSGLGRVLIVDMLRNALDMGFTTAISALMHTTNRSQQISSDCAGPMRGYSLFAKEL
jgi:N-acetylglutamate synthase-like GNAT family acetyltransferase